MWEAFALLLIKMNQMADDPINIKNYPPTPTHTHIHTRILCTQSNRKRLDYFVCKMENLKLNQERKKEKHRRDVEVETSSREFKSNRIK